MLVGVEMTMLVAANMCRVCVVVSASSFEAFTHTGKQKKNVSLLFLIP